MSSPFQTLDEFKQATDGPTEGAIYTFAHAPGVIGVALVVCVLPLLWFIYASYTVKAEESSKVSSPINLSVLIAAGLASLLGMLGHSDSPATKEAALRRDSRTPMSANHRQSAPIALLGLTSGALPLFRGMRKRPQRNKLRRASRAPRF